MILRRLLLAAAATLLAASIPSTTAKSSEPKISSSKFDNEPSSLFYFEDTDTVLFQDAREGNIHISTNAGDSWDRVKGPDGAIKGQAWALWPHPHDKKRAYVLGKKKKHWVTEDAAESWREFEADIELSSLRSPLVFHGKDSDKVVLQGQQCDGILCESKIYYTTDGFKTVKKLVDGARECMWAVVSPIFGEGNDNADKIDNRIFCIMPGLHSPWTKDNRLLFSDKFFEDDGTEAPLNDGRAVSGILRTAGVKRYLLAVTKSERTSELALYVTNDGDKWHRAQFDGQRLEEDAYTLLESTNHSIQIDVMSTKNSNPMGTLFSSNSNGRYFTRNIEHMNRNTHGYVDFEKIAGIQGIALVNVVDNWEEVEKSFNADKKIVSRITFDDGRTFQPLKVKDDDLHLHSVTDIANSGRVFSSPAPGLVMGVGNTGKRLKDYNDGDLYVSDDAGITWRKALEDAHKYEFGDQGSVLVAVYDEGRTEKISYSLNHGKDWKSAELPHKIRARQLTTTPDSTSLKFILVGTSKDSDKTYIMSIDFTDMQGKCGKDDFENWPARLNEKEEPDCLMGRQQFYRRRKADAKCFIDSDFKDPVPEFKPCKCTAEDFECDFNFVRSEDRKECVPARTLPVPEGECKKPEDEYTGSSGWRLIPGNECIRDGGEELDKEVKRPCKDTEKKPVTGDIAVEKTFFSADQFRDYFYLERTDTNTGDDETLMMLTSEQQIYMSKDHGKKWKEILEGEGVSRVVPHKYDNEAVYFLTNSKEGFYTIDRGDSFHPFKTELSPNRDKLPVLAFHPDHRDWLIWTGADECEGSGDCHSTAMYSINRGADWATLMRYVRRCEFIKREGRDSSDKLVFCEQYEDENLKNRRVQLLSTDNWFEHKTKHFDDIIDFATMSEFIIVAARAENQKSLKVDASVDGKTFAEAEFPANFDVPYQQAYTVLDSSTHSVFLHVTVNNMEDHEYGSIIKSNSNGTSYVLSIGGVNRNSPGYVDFEKMQGLEGVAIVNIVANVEEVEKGGAKKLKTSITHNDGAEWSQLPPPEKDAEGRAFDCKTKNGKPTEKCSLHLHGYTERRDPRDTYGSPSAVGLMMGIGNVGEFLGLRSEADTFITRDGGISWHTVKKGNYQWEYGDQGSIIVIVPESKPTKSLLYTLDEGETWKEFEFSEVEMQIDDISTVPSDTSRGFLLWGKEVGSGAKSGVATVALDFSGLKERSKKCVLREEDPEADDYYLWNPKHPMQEDNCLFGHVEQYHRKRPEKDCYNGRELQHLDKYAKTCECTRQDYECDYNYEPEKGGSCRLVPGLSPPNPMEVCKDDPNAVEYYEPTGYRRIPITTCENGLQLDRIKAHPCPGKDEEFEKKHPRLSAVGLFFAIALPLAAAGLIGWYIFTHWDGKFGRIRLGEGSSFSRNSGGIFDRDSLLISIPVAIVAGVVAFVAAIPLVISSLWRSASGYVRVPGSGGGFRGRSGAGRPYASRGAFAARRGDYVGVVDDEDELLGADEGDEDGDEEV
ncbi:hypothetical protein AJ80_06957 [Polytolypa hystricis UAMH7299]|uniref:Vacuolar protein sorting/targeting protein 10 n=1 Tax=Polytolypa hystricis (strain UAMH7299) TaxID=1447883 RepID=A0A2B7XS61_POLH7|nr:hypothetical protein AJ80_06957 [Polytolypa hystricis UAMH7299]